nr:proline-rich receptor-like protein kinase PERK2 [Lolium perenne]
MAAWFFFFFFFSLSFLFHHVRAISLPPSFSFDFSNTSSYHLQDLLFEGDTTLNGDVVDLTCNPMKEYCIGRMSYKHPVFLYDNNTGEWASFTTRFTFSIQLGPTESKGDGIAFFLSGYPSRLPLGSSGDQLGLTSRNNVTPSGADQFLAVEFDTYSSSSTSTGTQFTADHIGIDLNSIKSVSKTRLPPGYSLSGTMTATITFDNATRILEAIVHFDSNSSLGDAQVKTRLPDYLDTLLPPEVSVGFSAATGAYSELHQIHSWSFNSTMVARDKFSDKKKIGAGSFGVVYHGSLKNSKGESKDLAVKKINKDSGGESKDFLAELGAISQTRHGNVVRLEGWQNIKLFLVYELVPNGDLYQHLYERTTVLPWAMRYKIVQGLCSALHYLHHQCDPYILHRDIKPSNILLDNEFNAKLGDFGLSRVAKDNQQTSVPMTVAIGTERYMDPLCMKDGKVNFRRSSDVYSFGIVLLEIAHGGYAPVDVRKMHTDQPESFVDEIADVKLAGQFNKTQMEQVILLGLRCSEGDENQRPTFRGATNFLDTGAELCPATPTHE